MMFFRYLYLLVLTALLLLNSNFVLAQTTTVAVAANMKDAFGEILQEFKQNNKAQLRVVYGSSGNLATQIINGAPFNLLIAADEQFPMELYKHGKAMNEGAVYAIGKLALIAKSSSVSSLDNRAEIAKAIVKANKVAIAKPELAPYGKAAVEYLKAEGLWDLAKDKLVYGDNVGVATTYVVAGAADIGLTALSLAKSAENTKGAHYALVDSKLYDPIRQRMVLMKGAPTEAQELYQFMQGSQAKSILQKYGYATP